ncbi:MAG: class I SAM-dependent methyltransferase [Candidatus Doudnabacteria bacterium]|nr:class I SAM-dependent methyltransferase [Candidatus Doudnabacteria bacterium]
MLLESFKTNWDFELLDTGDGYRLEKWGDVILTRPDPQIIWPKSLPEEEWQKSWAIFKAGGKDEKGQWEIKKTLPKPWHIKFQNVKLLPKLSPFKHTGIFAEQAAQWEWMLKQISNPLPKPKILNLFAYTGGATMVLAKAGCQVTHVDASKPSITWANENYTLNNLPKDSVRWMLDDAVKFVKRELKRGASYDGIIMDPPAFGHSPSGKTWKFNNDIPGLLTDCINLLTPSALFLLINAYATNSSALALQNLLEDKIKNRPGKVEFGELCLEQKSSRKISTGIFTRWSAEGK